MISHIPLMRKALTPTCGNHKIFYYIFQSYWNKTASEFEWVFCNKGWPFLYSFTPSLNSIQNRFISHHKIAMNRRKVFLSELFSWTFSSFLSCSSHSPVNDCANIFPKWKWVFSDEKNNRNNKRKVVVFVCSKNETFERDSTEIKQFIKVWHLIWEAFICYLCAFNSNFLVKKRVLQGIRYSIRKYDFTLFSVWVLG